MAPAVGIGVDEPDFVGERLDVLTVLFAPGNWIFPLVAAAPLTAVLDTAELPGTLTGGPGMMLGILYAVGTAAMYASVAEFDMT